MLRTQKPRLSLLPKTELPDSLATAKNLSKTGAAHLWVVPFFMERVEDDFPKESLDQPVNSTQRRHVAEIRKVLAFL